MSNSKKKILFVMPGIPYPPRTHGISIRYSPLLTRFARDHHVDIVMITDGKGDGVANVDESAKAVDAVRAICRRAVVVRRDPAQKPSLLVRVLSRLLSRLPGSTPHAYVTYDRAACVAQIDTFIGSERYDPAVWAGSRYGEWLLDLLGRRRFGRVVVDSVDSGYLHLRRGSEGAVHSEREMREARDWESRLINAAAEAVYVSPVDAVAIPPEFINKTPRVLPNGVYVEGFKRDRVGAIGSPSIGYLGNMSYQPNVVAALYLFEKVFLPLKSRMPLLTLCIIGRDPVEQIHALAKHEGVVVTGAVDDIWPYVNAVDVFALPLQTGSGQQNKILEVMLAGKAIVTTTIGNGGIGATPGEELLVCDDAVDWPTQVGVLLDDPQACLRLGEAGRRFVSSRFDWDSIYAGMQAWVFAKPD